MKIWTKKLQVPTSNETKEIEAVQLWEVRWYSRRGPYSGDIAPEMEVFTSEQAAQEFALSLKNAFKLVRHTSGTGVQVKKSCQE